ncbi:hypothetical protein BTO18_16630 [Polaribacter porphyrae]|uniref:Aminotransferase class I/classII large domain-containing protein n=2 Tax=Polaribacter porphyrae TaxID=1137780 RepID=A0A2S7WSX3_9FLAO|nr:hypothetical protein BTO18_16630 [Polaribacter porphyrae]
MNLPKKLTNQLKSRKEQNALRGLKSSSNLIDFSSNDYLGFAKSEIIFDKTHQFLVDKGIKQNGATGSRLLSGNHQLYSEIESFLSTFHQTESTTIFNSGYDANIGFFSSVPQRGDIILYDEFIHASIRDGIKLSNAKAFKFLHNDLEDLEKRLLNFIDKNEIFRQAQSDKERDSELDSESHQTIYVVTESVFSMDGDSPDLVAVTKICKKHNAFLIVDEAHAVGVFAAGLIQKLNLQHEVFARIITFGKALGCHGAAILGSTALQTYLVNFARSFIYTTGLSPHSLATIKVSYDELQTPFDCNQDDSQNTTKLQQNIHHFIKEVKRLNFPTFLFGEMSERQWGFIPSCSAIHCCIIPRNEKVKAIAEKLQQNHYDVKAILSPTVPQNKERLRFCLHGYNSKKEISEVLEFLSIFVNQHLFMNDNYKILAVFEYSAEAHVTKSRLDADGFDTMLMDETTIDSDPLISGAIGGVKLLVHKNDFEKAVEVYNEIRTYQKDKNGNDIYCPKCNSNKILVAPLHRKNFFYMLFPFFEGRKLICNHCKTLFKN